MRERNDRKIYIISYDIKSDKLRAKIAKVLENFGKRVQYSVFELQITEKQYETLYRKLILLMSGENLGDIRIYKLCGKCENNISIIGVDLETGPSRSDEENIFII